MFAIFHTANRQNYPLASTCNCRIRCTCPLNGNCLINNIVYKCIITAKNNCQSYIRSTSNLFKSRYYVHTSSFRNAGLANTTSLAEAVNNYKNKNINYWLTWKILKRAKSYQGNRNECKFCSHEILQITKSKDMLLNERQELIITCSHKIRSTFKYYKCNQT